MGFRDNIKDELRTGAWVGRACVALIAFNAIGLLAGYHWLADLFVNFKLPYLLAAAILCAAALFYKRLWWALAMAALVVAIMIEIQTAYTQVFAKPSGKTPNFSIVQYNKYYYADNVGEFGEWLGAAENDFDIAIINEASPEISGTMQQHLKTEFPHQFPTNFHERLNDISILSKWPFEIAPIPMNRDGKTYNISKITLTKDGLPPVTIYAYHTQTPVGPNDAALRNFELETFAAMVRADKTRHSIMIGDWNVTPWSPHFKNMLAITRMNYQNFGLLPEATFPGYTRFSLLQMPIDHILFDDYFDLVSIRKGPASGSDHHSLIARFHVAVD